TSFPWPGSSWARASAASPTTSRIRSRSRSRTCRGRRARPRRGTAGCGADAPVRGRAGRLLLGGRGGKPVVMLHGRLHMYEGNDPGLVVQPVLLFQRLGGQLGVLDTSPGGVGHARGGRA